MNKWNIKRISKDTYYWQRTIELRNMGWSLRRIYENEFKFKNWGTYSKVFFKRIFKNDPVVSGTDGNLHRRIEKAYKPI
ncbi:MAG: hypothetical protein V3V33_00485 [Candidatus Lokiarchaeia archaeon]